MCRFARYVLAALPLTVCSMPVLAEPPPTVAVFDFASSSLSEAEVTLVVDYLSAQIVETGRFRVLDRGQREAILREQEFSLSDCSDQRCQIEAGRLLSADFILVGSIGRLSETFLFNVRLVDVETSETVRTASRSYANLERIVLDCRDVAFVIAGLPATGSAAGATAAPLPPAEKTPRVQEYLISVVPETARIYLDGEEIGGGPRVTVETTWGKHRIRVEQKRFYPETRKVKVGPEHADSVEIRLNPKGGLGRALLWTSLGSTLGMAAAGGYTWSAYQSYLSSPVAEIPQRYQRADTAFVAFQALAVGSGACWVSWLIQRWIASRR